MKNILVIGSTGQIGSELVPALRTYLNETGTVVAGYTSRTPLPQDIKEAGPSALVNVCDKASIETAVKNYEIDTIYNLAALLSATAESVPLKAWDVGINGLFNVLEIARENHCSVFTPSSIGAFGPNTPKLNTPQDTIMRPTTMYGITKVTGELLSNYYYNKYETDTRSVRYPGLISYKTPPGGGTTDYAVEIFWSAVKGEPYKCPIAPDTPMDFMYMPDAIRAAIELMIANPENLKHRNSFNLSAMSFTPAQLAKSISKKISDFKITYEVDPLRQSIAESWPDSLDETCAEEEWGWKPEFDMENMVGDMLENVQGLLNKGNSSSKKE
ncbi:MAG: NAD-dependent epimerase/dehydratase family protein [Burkholderiales bacterium]|nr:NAD-dependent epimerase/dehydratase family protein [Burkholderiales bacterium]